MFNLKDSSLEKNLKQLEDFSEHVSNFSKLLIEAKLSLDKKPLLFENYKISKEDKNELKIEHFDNFFFKGDKFDEEALNDGKALNYVFGMLFKHEDTLSKLFKEPFIVVTNKQFALMTNDYNLPVIARNQLENGESKNLFYEQIIPRESKFFFITNRIEEGEKAPKVDYFEEYLFKRKYIEKMPVQIGANASIGYGFSTIERFTIT